MRWLKRLVSLGEPFYPRLAITLIVKFFLNTIFPQPLQEDIKPSVRERHGLHHLPYTAYRKHLGIAFILFLPVTPEQGHADERGLGLNDIVHHGAVARLKDMQRKLDTREKDDIRQRKNRNNVG